MLLAHFLDRVLHRGDLRLIDAQGKQWRFGDGTRPRATIRLHDRRLHWRLAVNPKLAIGEAYMDGTLTVEEGTLYDLLDILSYNLDFVESHISQSIGTMVSHALRFLQQYNPVGKAQRNVAHHYDLSDELYDLFLDDDRQYSCAYFSSEHDSLEQAQLNKKCHLAAKLLLTRPNLKLLEIGSGWGGLAMYLAQQGAACVDGVTLSVEQHKVSTR
ncbi:MAG: class I SAM-dependent methyltransferase, partial [Alphaproteobacteria bacterium]